MYCTDYPNLDYVNSGASTGQSTKVGHGIDICMYSRVQCMQPPVAVFVQTVRSNKITFKKTV